MFRTATPCNCATLFRLKSLVMDLALVDLRQFDQLQIDLADRWEVIFTSGSTAWPFSAGAAERPARGAPGYALANRPNRLPVAIHANTNCGVHDDAIQKPGFGNVGDAAVDDDTGVENLVALLPCFSPPKIPPRAARFQAGRPCSHPRSGPRKPSATSPGFAGNFGCCR